MSAAEIPGRVRFEFCALLLISMSGCGANSPLDSSASVSLDAWQQTGNVRWRFVGRGVEAGPAEATGYLVSQDQYRDLTLTVELWIEDATNSGVFLRCSDSTIITPDNCYEINIWDNHPQQDFRSGSVVKRRSPLAQVDTLDKWNTIRINLSGSMIRVTMNDIVTAHFEDESLTEGYIALQYAGKGVLKFRNLQLRVDK